MRRRRWTKEQRREQYRKGMFLLPSSFTVLNIWCGFYSVSLAVNHNYEPAALLIGIAMVLDTLDGRIARLTHTASEFGVQFDSLADVITFGIAPAVLAYQWVFFDFDVHSIARLGWMICFVFLICAASRLARFNVQKTAGNPDKRYFVGMPTPAAAGMVAATVYCFPERISDDYAAIAALFMMAVLSFLMVSRIRYRSFKDINLREPHPYRMVVLLALALVMLWFYLAKSLITLASIYLLSGLVGAILSRKRKSTTEPPPDSVTTSPGI